MKSSNLDSRDYKHIEATTENQELNVNNLQLY